MFDCLKELSRHQSLSTAISDLQKPAHVFLGPETSVKFGKFLLACFIERMVLSVSNMLYIFSSGGLLANFYVYIVYSYVMLKIIFFSFLLFLFGK